MTEIRKPYILYGVIIALILVILSSGGYGYKYHEDALKGLNDSITVIKEQKKEVDLLLYESSHRITEKKENYKTYWYELQKEKKKTKELERSFKDLDHILYNTTYLDSLKSSVLYR